MNATYWKSELRYHGDAIILGSLIGLGAGVYMVSNGFDYHSLFTSGKALFDSVFSRSVLTQDQVYKFYAAMLVIGAVFGYYVSKALNFFGFSSKRRYNNYRRVYRSLNKRWS